MKKIFEYIIGGIIVFLICAIIISILFYNRGYVVLNDLNQIKTCSNIYIDREEIKIKVSIVEVIRGKYIKVQTIFPDKQFNMYKFDLNDIRFMQCSTNIWVKDFGNKLLRELNK